MIAAERRLARVGWNALSRLGAQVWAKALSLVLAPLVVRLAGPTELGRYLMALTVTSIVAAVTDLGLTIYLTREGAQIQDPIRNRRFLGDILVMKTGLAALGYGLLAAVAPVLPLPEVTRQLLPIAGLALVPEAATAALHAFLNARQRMDLSSGILAIVRLVATAGALLALTTGKAAAAILWWHVTGTVAGTLISLSVLWAKFGSPIIQPGALLHRRTLRQHLVEALPFAATGFIAMLYRRLDLLLLGSWHGELVAGWYGAATRLWEAVHLVPASLLDALFPEMSRMASQPGGRQRLRLLLKGGGAVLFAGGSGLAVLGALGGPQGLRLIYGAGVADATVQTWQVLVWAIPAIFLYLLGGHTLYAVREQRAVTGRMVVVALVNAVANLVLIARWRHIGAAMVLLASEWLLCLLLYGRAWRVVAMEEEQHET
ncbi:MAG: oligosaccharide flippase family protein [Anaerolineae bacterium]|nr:oligosaccharide flippase family protein [Anaerolineae bacterium]